MAKELFKTLDNGQWSLQKARMTQQELMDKFGRASIPELRQVIDSAQDPELKAQLVRHYNDVIRKKVESDHGASHISDVAEAAKRETNPDIKRHLNMYHGKRIMDNIKSEIRDLTPDQIRRRRDAEVNPVRRAAMDAHLQELGRPQQLKNQVLAPMSGKSIDFIQSRADAEKDPQKKAILEEHIAERKRMGNLDTSSEIQGDVREPFRPGAPDQDPQKGLTPEEAKAIDRGASTQQVNYAREANPELFAEYQRQQQEQAAARKEAEKEMSGVKAKKESEKIVSDTPKISSSQAQKQYEDFIHQPENKAALERKIKRDAEIKAKKEEKQDKLAEEHYLWSERKALGIPHPGRKSEIVHSLSEHDHPKMRFLRQTLAHIAEKMGEKELPESVITQIMNSVSNDARRKSEKKGEAPQIRGIKMVGGTPQAIMSEAKTAVPISRPTAHDLAVRSPSLGMKPKDMKLREANKHLFEQDHHFDIAPENSSIQNFHEFPDIVKMVLHDFYDKNHEELGVKPKFKGFKTSGRTAMIGGPQGRTQVIGQEAKGLDPRNIRLTNAGIMDPAVGAMAMTRSMLDNPPEKYDAAKFGDWNKLNDVSRLIHHHTAGSLDKLPEGYTGDPQVYHGGSMKSKLQHHDRAMNLRDYSYGRQIPEKMQGKKFSVTRVKDEE